MFTRNIYILFSLTLPSLSVLSLAACCWLFSLPLSSHSPLGWKEPGDDHKCLAADGMSPLRALLCDHCVVIVIWFIFGHYVCILWALPSFFIFVLMFTSNCCWRHEARFELHLITFCFVQKLFLLLQWLFRASCDNRKQRASVRRCCQTCYFHTKLKAMVLSTFFILDLFILLLYVTVA